MAERPIIFNDEMARAILDGRKTVTRRPVKSNSGPPPTLVHRTQGPSGRHWTEPGGWVPAPAAVGDVLYVRECFAPAYFGPGSHGYRADWTREAADVVPTPRWTPSIHMPRTAARIFLRVTSVHVERIQAITEDGARAEGVPSDDDYPLSFLACLTCRGDGVYQGASLGPYGWGATELDCERCLTSTGRFRSLWDGIYAAKGLGWEANPWCWVIGFERVEAPHG